MRKFCFNLFCFLIFPLFLIGLVEFCIFSFKSRLFSENNLDSIFKEGANDYEWIKTLMGDSLVVLAGSSSVKYGLSCNVLNNLSSDKYKFVNIANDARDPIETYFIIKNMDIKKVSAVYFGLDPWIYTKRYYMYRNSFLYLDFSFIEILHFSEEHDKSSLLKRYKIFFKHFFPGKQRTTHYKNITIPIDFGSVALEGKAINFNQPENNFFQIDKFGWSDLQFKYLQKISLLCKDKNIRFSVFVPPKRSDYSKVYKEKYTLIHEEYIGKLVNIGFNSPIFGRFDQLDTMGETDSFTEAFHLNKSGQELYSRIFYELANKQTSIFSRNHNWFSKTE